MKGPRKWVAVVTPFLSERHASVISIIMRIPWGVLWEKTERRDWPPTKKKKNELKD